MDKAVFLDRDGVINRKATTEDRYITRWEDFEIFPCVSEAIARLNSGGFQVIVVTNQRAISKGLLTEAELGSIHRRMCEHLTAEGAIIDRIYYCPHDLDPPCTCRKPQPGMLFQASLECHIELAKSWMVGDSEKDVEAGRRAGCRTIRIMGDLGSKGASCADLVAPSLSAAAHEILNLQSQVMRGAPRKGQRAW